MKDIIIVGCITALLGFVIGIAIEEHRMHNQIVSHGYGKYIPAPCGCGSTFVWTK